MEESNEDQIQNLDPVSAKQWKHEVLPAEARC